MASDQTVRSMDQAERKEARSSYGITRLDQSKLRESAYEAIRDAFTRGEFAPGETLSLRLLADQLGISMTPVREAVRRLVAEGVLLDTTNRKLMVPPFNVRRMKEIFAARLALEPRLLDMTIIRMSPELPDVLQAILDAPKSRRGIMEHNRNFHFTLYSQSGSEVLLPMVEALWVQHGIYLNLASSEEAKLEGGEDNYHYKIIKALRERDSEAAQAALKADIMRSYKLMSDSFGLEE